MLKNILTHILYFFLLGLLSNACSPESVKINDINQQQEKNNFAPIKAVRANYKILDVKGPAITKAIEPTGVLLNPNIRLAEKPLITKVSQAKNYVVGTDTFLQAYTNTVKPKVIFCKNPRAIIAEPSRFKDAASYFIQYIDVEQGLSYSKLRAIVKDKLGNIWIATEGAGISRYDGQSFYNYTVENGLPSNKALNLFIDSKNNVWVATEEGGVSCFNGHTFKNYDTKTGFIDNTILCIYEDKDGRMWFGSNGGGVCCLKDEKLISYTTSQGLSNNQVRSIVQDKLGNFWFSTVGGGTNKFDGKQFTRYTTNEGLSYDIILSSMVDKDGNIWFGTDDGGIDVFDGNSFKNYSKNNGLIDNSITSLYQDSKNNVWIGTYTSGVILFNGKTFTSINESQGLTGNNITSILEDNSGNIWLSTYGGGLCKFNEMFFKNYTQNEGIGKSVIRGVCEDNSKRKWLASYGNGILKIENNQLYVYTENNGLRSATFKTAPVVDKENNIWFATEANGIIKFDGKYFYNYSTENGLIDDYIHALFIDSNNNLWIGTEDNGLCVFDGKVFKSYSKQNGLCGNYITSITQDQAGNIWIASDGGGISKFAHETFYNYSKNQGLINQTINTIYCDKKGNILIGTDGSGLQIIPANQVNSDKPNYYFLNESNSLLNNNVKSIIQDNNTNYWIGTKYGLYYWQHALSDSSKITSFHSEDGLKSNDFYAGSVGIDSENHIWWGTGKALSEIDLNEFKLTQKAPTIQLNAIELNQNFIDFNTLAQNLKSVKTIQINNESKLKISKSAIDSCSSFYNYPIKLILPYELNQITFKYSAIDWIRPNKIKYQYKLEGLDENWSPLVNDNKMLYNLPAGNYTFKVRAQGISSVWSDEASYNFTVLSPWWLTWWAYGLYLILVIVFVIQYTKLRTKKLIKQKILLENTVTERTAEVVKQKEIVEEKQKEIVDSINYAKRIQKALLASDKLFKSYFNENYFVFYQPKDIVSGDFYWATSTANDNHFMLVTGDCTGHGVPGAFMSLLSISLLNEVVNEKKVTEPGDVLGQVRERIIFSLASDGSDEGGSDGMDCSIISVDVKNKKLKLAGANNPVWITRKINQNNLENFTVIIENCEYGLIEIKTDKMPVGKHPRDNQAFNSFVFNLEDGDRIFTLTDGICDQFGGPDKKKFTYKAMKNLLIKSNHLPINQQKNKVNTTVSSWMFGNDQTDDILMIGLQV
ncbi:MAG: SpoIIE family protein phosphatase [Bacteroidetes bacterium]|nr:SpoIIE family protein phosphatase [Bacteroidota bacterium]